MLHGVDSKIGGRRTLSAMFPCTDPSSSTPPHPPPGARRRFEPLLTARFRAFAQARVDWSQFVDAPRALPDVPVPPPAWLGPGGYDCPWSTSSSASERSLTIRASNLLGVVNVVCILLALREVGFLVLDLSAAICFRAPAYMLSFESVTRMWQELSPLVTVVVDLRVADVRVHGAGRHDVRGLRDSRRRLVRGG